MFSWCYFKWYLYEKRGRKSISFCCTLAIFHSAIVTCKTMSLQKLYEYINSLSVCVDSLQMQDTLLFSRRYDKTDAIDEPLEESFQKFISTIKSLRCIMSDKFEIHMTRYFTKKEVLLGKVSRNMQTYLWSLGYISIGAGLFEEVFEPEKRKMVEVMFFVEDAFKKTLPPVRSLQSLAFDAVQKCGDRELPDYLTDNPTFSQMECLQMSKDTVIFCDFRDFFGDGVSLSSIHYVGATKDTVMSYYFTTCLLLIEQNVKIKYNSTSHQLENALLFDSRKLTKVDMLINSLLLGCLKDISEKSPNVKTSVHRCDHFWGLVFSIPLHTNSNKAILRQFLYFLATSESKYLDKCFINTYSQEPIEECRDCQELEAVHEACITFLLGAVNRFWHNNFQ